MLNVDDTKNQHSIKACVTSINDDHFRTEGGRNSLASADRKGKSSL